MLGFRGASRYVSENFADCFELECRALKYVRDEMGLTNIKIMIPFVRTTKGAKAVIELLEKHGLKRQQKKSNHLLIPIDCHRKHIFVFPVEPCIS